MKNKGFTLIELLAVIVILAIIALIATPIVLGIINDSRDSAKVNSAQFIIDGVQTAYAVAYTKSYADDPETTDKNEAKASGEIPTLANIVKEIEFKNATPVIEDGKLVVKTGETDDALKCVFEIKQEENENILTSDTCGFTKGEIEPTKIGAVSGVEPSGE